MIGIVLLLIITDIYLLYINYKEGFDGAAPEKVSLIPISTIDKFYNKLTDPTDKDIVAPIVELYKVFVTNYNDAFEVSIQISDANKDIAAVEDSIPLPTEPDYTSYDQNDYSAAQNDYYKKSDEVQQLRAKARTDTQQKWAPIINPGVAKVLTSAIKWLPTGKQFYDKFVMNNYYGLIDGTNNPEYLAPRLIQVLINTLYEDDQLSILLGPTFAKSNPNPPIKLPVYVGQISALMKDQQKMEILMNPLSEYIKKALNPFMIIQGYIMTSTVLPDTIIQLIDQLNNALANNTTNLATIGQLTGKLNLALANDAADQATINNLQGRVDNLQSRQANMSIQPGPIKQAPINNMPSKPVFSKPMAHTNRKSGR